MDLFLFILADNLGQTVSQLRENLGNFNGVPEEYYWLAYNKIFPFRNKILSDIGLGLNKKSMAPAVAQSPTMMREKLKTIPGLKYIHAK